MGFGWNAPSEEDLEQGGDYVVLAEDEYIARVKSIELKKDQPNKYPTPNDNEPVHDMLVLKAEALTFADGEPLVDKEGEAVEGSVPFQVWLNPKKRGMVPQPAKTRKAFAAILGQALGDPINIGDFAELEGKTFIVSLKPNGTYNNAMDFRPAKRNRTRGTTAKGPVDSVDLAARAKEIFDEDAPDNKSAIGATEKPRTASANEDDLDF